MKNIFLLTLSALSLSGSSQTDSLILQNKIDSINKHQIIYFYTADQYSTLTSENRNTGRSSSSTSRSIKFYFKVGVDGPFIKVSKKGGELKSYIENDSMALAEFNAAMKHRKKSKLYNRLEFLGYFVAVGACVPGVIGLIKKDDNDDTALPYLIGGGAGIVGGFVLINVYKFKTDKELDRHIGSMNSCVFIYNQNLLSKVK